MKQCEGNKNNLHKLDQTGFADAIFYVVYLVFVHTALLYTVNVYVFFHIKHCSIASEQKCQVFKEIKLVLSRLVTEKTMGYYENITFPGCYKSMHRTISMT